MNSNSESYKEELHAFLDGELDPIRAAEFSKLIAADPVLAARLAAFRSDKERLSQIYGSLRDLPLPPEWTEPVGEWLETQPLPRRLRFRGSHRVVAAIAACLLLMAGLWLGYDRFILPSEDRIVAEAFAARQNLVRPEESLAATSVAPDTVNRMLATSLAMMVKAPDLTKLGYRLTEIHVYSGRPKMKSVELEYRNAQDRLFTLYLRQPTGAPRVDLVEREGLRICIWQDDVLGAVMVGQMSAGEMARIASLAYSGLTL